MNGKLCRWGTRVWGSLGLILPGLILSEIKSKLESQQEYPSRPAGERSEGMGNSDQGRVGQLKQLAAAGVLAAMSKDSLSLNPPNNSGGTTGTLDHFFPGRCSGGTAVRLKKVQMLARGK